MDKLFGKAPTVKGGIFYEYKIKQRQNRLSKSFLGKVWFVNSSFLSSDQLRANDKSLRKVTRDVERDRR